MERFSWRWVALSVAVYTVVEIALAVAMSPLSLGARLGSPMLALRVQMIMHLASFVVGGGVLGWISAAAGTADERGLGRAAEVGIGAVFAVALTLLIGVFMPMPWMSFSLEKLVIGGGIAGALALTGYGATARAKKASSTRASWSSTKTSGSSTKALSASTATSMLVPGPKQRQR